MVLEGQSATTWETITNVIPLLEDVDGVTYDCQAAIAPRALPTQQTTALEALKHERPAHENDHALVCDVPLMQHLSSLDFREQLDRLSQMSGSHEEPEGDEHKASDHLCACGCGQAVSPPRKFVNQDHYDTWRTREQA